eukprot:12371-Heterococcus_DN1.PRE.2
MAYHQQQHQMLMQQQQQQQQQQHYKALPFAPYQQLPPPPMYYHNHQAYQPNQRPPYNPGPWQQQQQQQQLQQAWPPQNHFAAHGGAPHHNAVAPVPPPPSYTCHACGGRGHWITDCKRPPKQAAPTAAASKEQDAPAVQTTSSTAQQQQPPLAAAAAAAATKADAQAEPPAAPAEEGAWFCEPCEKDFASEAQRAAHLATHEACTHEGCTFSGTRKHSSCKCSGHLVIQLLKASVKWQQLIAVVVAHHHAKHGKFAGSGFKNINVEGQKFRVLLGTSPEEVAQWRAERRRCWPSKQNVERKEETGGRDKVALHALSGTVYTALSKCCVLHEYVC